MKMPWEARTFKAFIDRYQASLGLHDLPIYVLGNHDTHRLATRLGPAAARTAAMLQLTLPGAAFVYYGEELGLRDVSVPPNRVQDPFEKRIPGLGLGRDPERTPLPWSGVEFGGFSTSEPWLPLGPDYPQHNVHSELTDPSSSLHLYQKLIHLRNISPILQYGDYQPLETHHPDSFGFVREYRGFKYAVILNFSARPATIATNLGSGLLLYSAQLLRESGLVNLSQFTLPPHEGYIVAIEH
jgi:alpha-glucosidase